ncbi:YigZ family protein [Fictibacillus barbaricus]|uniref:YigZ family protein n=1 Tax=Fictibacillus barbaricus TaxID=182136 RepID=A0ABS2ZH46_9BACL|nr:YigZ family protein [Fictibacillus barbaricus]MBN3546756.1 YigZ family protein [Fictibacillus barbaricus]GGB43598.1 IMPACT family member YvyE [Fictibacillus barbaricus]
MLSDYLTVKETGQHEIVIEKSRFIAHIARAKTEDEAIQFIQSIKKEHNSATHNCSAYLIGETDNIQKANDDGEPSGTAGVPMLEVLKKKELKDTVAVVTRYFGGIKLGAGGLIRAYGKAVSEGLKSIGVVERQLQQIVHITVDYTLLGKMENELRNSVYPIKEMNYLDKVEIQMYVPIDKAASFKEWITDLSNAQSEIVFGGQAYLEKDV